MQSLKSNTELNEYGIIASSNVPNTATLKYAGDNQTQVPKKRV